jgi:hypothetical protein
MVWREPVIDYCERQDHSFWSEPLNAATNAAFLFAAAAAFMIWRRQAKPDLPALALIVVTAIVGAGSFIFHTIATRGAMWLDVVPIAIFIYVYFFLALRRFFGLAAPASVAITILFASGSYLLQAHVHGLNGSVGYLPALAALIFFAALLGRPAGGGSPTARSQAAALSIAAALFATSLCLRTIDRDVCSLFPHGTHFLWHVLNATVLWLLLRTAILAGAGRESAATAA